MGIGSNFTSSENQTKKFQIVISESLHEEMNALASLRGVSMGRLIKDLLEEAVEKRRDDIDDLLQKRRDNE